MAGEINTDAARIIPIRQDGVEGGVTAPTTGTSPSTPTNIDPTGLARLRGPQGNNVVSATFRFNPRFNPDRAAVDALCAHVDTCGGTSGEVPESRPAQVQRIVKMLS